MEYILQMKSWS